MSKKDLLFEIGRACPEMANEVLALQKRLDKDGEFAGPAKEANEIRFAKLCRDALETGEFVASLRKRLEEVEAILPGPGRPSLPDEETRKPRSIRMTDAEWAKIKAKADALDLPMSEFIRLKTIGEDTVKEVNYGLYKIIGDRADEAADALDKEERNLDFLYEGIAPSREGYEEAKVKIFARISEDFNVKIR